jgi:hypothetical protein
MPPKPRQLRAPRPKQPGNAFQALVDLPEDGSDSTFDGRDGIVDGTDDNTVVIANPRDSGPPAVHLLLSCQSTATATPPAISATTTEVIDFSIEFGLAVLDYVVLEISRTLHVDSVEFHREIRVFTRFSRVLARPAVFGRPASRDGHP